MNTTTKETETSRTAKADYNLVTDCDYCGQIAACRCEDQGGTVCCWCDDEDRGASYAAPKSRSWSYTGSDGIELTDASDLEIDLLLDDEIDRDHERDLRDEEIN